MVIRHNIPAINLSNSLNINKGNLSKSIEKLSSGFRINRASDDAAGLSISEKMRTQIRGLDQAQNNVQDGISLIQVAEGALSEVHGCLQRANELLVQSANGTYVNEDRQDIQDEVDSLLKEIDNIANSTSFNNIKLLDGSTTSGNVSDADKEKFISWLNGSWLNDAATKAEAVTGWKLGADTELSVTFKSVSGKGVASMSGWYLGKDLTLNINTNYMATGTAYNGKDGPTYGGIPADRLITHEMVHGLMFNNVSNTAKPPLWFAEGIAESVHGATDVRYGNYEFGMETDFSIINDEIQGFDFKNSAGNDKCYSVGIIATSYLYNKIESHSAGGFKNMMGEMRETDESFEDLVVKYTGEASYDDFLSTMKKDAQDAQNAGTFQTTFLEDKCKINIKDGKADPLVGADATSSDVVPNKGSETAPSGKTTTVKVGSTNIKVNWNSTSQGEGIVLQIGNTQDQTLKLSIDGAKTFDLGIENLSATTQENARNSLKTCKDAIDTVSKIRSSLGAYQNRLEHTMKNLSTTMENTQNAESRIRDVDMAKEMMKYTKSNVLMQAGQALCAQVNQLPNRVLQLLQ